MQYYFFFFLFNIYLFIYYSGYSLYSLPCHHANTNQGFLPSDDSFSIPPLTLQSFSQPKVVFPDSQHISKTNTHPCVFSAFAHYHQGNTSRGILFDCMLSKVAYPSCDMYFIYFIEYAQKNC